MLAAVILAAGESRRMKRPKALLPFPTEATTPGKVTFLEHLISTTRHPRVGPLRIVLGASAERIQQRVPLDAGSIVLNENWEQGQLSSLQAAIRALPKGTDGLMLMLVDHPLITTRLVADLVDRFYESRARIVVPTYAGRRGHPVIFASNLFEELLAAPLGEGARAVVHAHTKEVLEIPTEEEGVILNLNDPEALKRAIHE
jgi:molybdenum cofactor cytidylyltransferase